MNPQTTPRASFRPAAKRETPTLSKQFVISNEAEYEAAFPILDAYFAKMGGDESKLTTEEHDHFEVVALAIEGYEQEHYPIQTFSESLIQHFPVNTWNSEKLQRFRAEFNLTIDDVAKIIGLQPTEIMAIEQGSGTLQRTASMALDYLDEYIRDSLYGERS